MVNITAMAAELGNRSDPGSTGGSWVWNPIRARDEDDSWEVRAFAEDAGNIMGTTWPPRSYTCTFCRREFKSAQALGGHMNVHRRDRARLQQSPPSTTVPTGSSSSSLSSPLIFPPQEFVANGGLCLVYQLQNPNPDFTQSPSVLSPSPYPHNYKLIPSVPSSVLFQLAQTANLELSSSNYRLHNKVDEHPEIFANDEQEELDLELRLGHGRPS